MAEKIGQAQELPCTNNARIGAPELEAHGPLSCCGSSLSLVARAIEKLLNLPPPERLEEPASIDVDDDAADIDGALVALEYMEDTDAWVGGVIDTAVLSSMPSELAVTARELAEKLFIPWSKHAAVASSRLLEGKISATDIAFIRLALRDGRWFPYAEEEGISVPELIDPDQQVKRVCGEVETELSRSGGREETLLRAWETGSPAISSIREKLHEESSNPERAALIELLVEELADALPAPNTWNSTLVNILAGHELISRLTGRTMDPPNVAVRCLSERQLRLFSSDYLDELTTRGFSVGFDVQGHLGIGMPVTVDAFGRYALLSPDKPKERELLLGVLNACIEELIHCQQRLCMKEVDHHREKEDREEIGARSQGFGAQSRLAILYCVRTGVHLDRESFQEMDALARMIELYQGRNLPLEGLRREMYENQVEARHGFVKWLLPEDNQAAGATKKAPGA